MPSAWRWPTSPRHSTQRGDSRWRCEAGGWSLSHSRPPVPHEHSGGAGFRPTALYPVKTGVHPLVRFQFTSAAVLAALASVACSNEPPKRPDLADLLNQQLAERRAAAVASIQLSMEIDTAWQSRVRAAPGLGGGLLSIDLQDFLTSTHAPPVLLE